MSYYQIRVTKDPEELDRLYRYWLKHLNFGKAALAESLADFYTQTSFESWEEYVRYYGLSRCLGLGPLDMDDQDRKRLENPRVRARVGDHSVWA